MIDERWDGRCVISAKFDPLAFVISPLAFFLPEIWVNDLGVGAAFFLHEGCRFRREDFAQSCRRAAANFGCKTIRLLCSLPAAH